MLTKSDLKQIQNVLREEIVAESKNTEQNLSAEIKLTRIEIQNEMSSIGKRLKNVEMVLGKIQKDLNGIVNFFDKEYIALRKKVEKIEEFINFPRLND